MTFWNKKKDPLESLSTGIPEASIPEAPSPPIMEPRMTSSDGKIDLINSKLDTVIALLRSLEQRIVNLERIAGEEEQPPLYGRH